MKFAKLLEMWKKFLVENLEEDGFSGNGPLAEPVDIGEEEEILDEEEDFQKAVTVFDPATPALRAKGEESSLVARGP